MQYVTPLLHLKFILLSAVSSPFSCSDSNVQLAWCKPTVGRAFEMFTPNSKSDISTYTLVNPAIIWALTAVQLSKSNYRAWAFWVKCCLVPGRRTESRELTSIELIPSCTISTSWGGNQAGKICRFACPTQILKGGFSTIFEPVIRWVQMMATQHFIVRDLWDALFYFLVSKKRNCHQLLCKFCKFCKNHLLAWDIFPLDFFQFSLLVQR